MLPYFIYSPKRLFHTFSCLKPPTPLMPSSPWTNALAFYYTRTLSSQKRKSTAFRGHVCMSTPLCPHTLPFLNTIAKRLCSNPRPVPPLCIKLHPFLLTQRHCCNNIPFSFFGSSSLYPLDQHLTIISPVLK